MLRDKIEQHADQLVDEETCSAMVCAALPGAASNRTLGFIALSCALMLLRVRVGMAMGLVGVSGFGYLAGFLAGAEAGRPDLDAHGDRLYVRRDPMFLLMGTLWSAIPA